MEYADKHEDDYSSPLSESGADEIKERIQEIHDAVKDIAKAIVVTGKQHNVSIGPDDLVGMLETLLDAVHADEESDLRDTLARDGYREPEGIDPVALAREVTGRSGKYTTRQEDAGVSHA